MTVKVKIKGVSNELARIKKLQDVIIEKKLLVTSIAMKEALKRRTPVDTGNARDSWSVSKTALGYGVSNSADYIDELNAGSSKQAPPYFIENTSLIFGKPSGNIVQKK